MITPTSNSEAATALVVDDELLVASFLADALEDMGFAVKTAATVAQALDITRMHGSWSVAFVDLGLPDRSGLELISELQVMHPDLPVIIASGYGEMARRDLSDMKGSESGRVAVLSKPYDTKAISRILDDVGVAKPD